MLTPANAALTPVVPAVADDVDIEPCTYPVLEGVDSIDCEPVISHTPAVNEIDVT